MENRDKLHIIKEYAKQGKFDILLVFMFDSIGRIADETPFVVEWFVKNGVYLQVLFGSMTDEKVISN